MTRPFHSQSRRKTGAKPVLTLADLKKIQKLNNNRISLTNAYEIVGGYKNADDKTYATAMRMVESDDKEFAENLKKSALANQRPSLKNLITLYDAYEIAGGYRTADRETFEKAMALVEADDASFAASLKEMHKGNQIKTLSSEADLKIGAEALADNTDFIYRLFEEDKQLQPLKNAVMNDEEVIDALNNTPFYGVDSQTDENFNLSAEDKEESSNALYENSKAEALYNLADDIDFAKADETGKKEKLKSEVKHSLLHTLTHLRLSSQIKSDDKERIKALKEGDEGFFSRQVSKIHDAFNFKKEIKVSGVTALSVFKKTQDKMSAFAKGLTELAQKSKDNSKKMLSKAAVSVRKATLYLVMASTLAAPTLSSCSHGTQQRNPQENGGIPQKEIQKQAPKPQTEEKETQQAQEHQEEKKADAIMVPTAWEASMGITEAQWTRLQSYWGGQEKYAEFYQRIDQNMIEDGGIFAGKTREQVLFQYERLSSWNLTNHQSTIAKMDAFFGDCGKQLSAEDAAVLNDVMPNGAIKDVDGTACVRVTGKNIECGGENKPQTENVDCGCDEQNVEIQAVKKQTKENEPTDISFTEVPGTSTTVTITTDSITTAAANVKILKATNLQGGKVIGTTGSETVSNVQAQNIKIVLGEGKGATGDDLFGDGIAVEQSGSSVETAKDTVSVTNNDIRFTEVQGTSTVVDDLFGDNVTIASSGNSVTAVTDTLGGENIKFTEVQGTFRTVSVEQTETAKSDETVTGTVQEQTVADSEEIAAGTPAADNVPERGGYMNTGLTERQYKRMETFFKDKSGNDAFDVYLDRVSDDMREKGGIFEGLSKAEALYSVQQMVAWSNDQHGKFAKEITTAINYFKECDDTIAKSELSSIKDIVDRVNENGTIDGVNGTGNKVVRYFKANDCGDAGTYGINEVEGNSETTTPTGNKFPRFFKKVWNIAPIAFNEIEGTTTVIEVQQTVNETVQPNIVVVKANNLEAGNVIATDVAPNEVSGIKTQDIRIVLGEKNAAPEKEATETKVKDAKERVVVKVSKKAARKAAKAQKKADEARETTRREAQARGLTGNPALDKYITR